MNPPGLASVAPAPTMATAGESATRPMRATMPATFSRFGGRRSSHTIQTTNATAATTSKIATQVFGCEGSSDAARPPSAKAATTPTARVAPKAPT